MTESIIDKEPFVGACIPAFNEERSIAEVVVGVLENVDRVVVCGDGFGF